MKDRFQWTKEVIDNMVELILLIGFVEVTANIIFLISVRNWNSLSLFNPIRNYNTWAQYNWFGIAIITTLLNIILFPYAISYWIYKLFTVGR